MEIERRKTEGQVPKELRKHSRVNVRHPPEDLEKMLDQTERSPLLSPRLVSRGKKDQEGGKT